MVLEGLLEGFSAVALYRAFAAISLEPCHTGLCLLAEAFASLQGF